MAGRTSGRRANISLSAYATPARNPAQGYKAVGYMNGIVRQSDRLSKQMRTTFKDLLPPESIEEYIATRLGLFKDELDDINEKAKALK